MQRVVFCLSCQKVSLDGAEMPAHLDLCPSLEASSSSSSLKAFQPWEVSMMRRVYGITPDEIMQGNIFFNGLFHSQDLHTYSFYSLLHTPIVICSNCELVSKRNFDFNQVPTCCNGCFPENGEGPLWATVDLTEQILGEPRFRNALQRGGLFYNGGLYVCYE